MRHEIPVSALQYREIQARDLNIRIATAASSDYLSAIVHGGIAEPVTVAGVETRGEGFVLLVDTPEPKPEAV